MASKAEHKFKMTPQRAAILGCLDGDTSHPSAEDIYARVKRRMPMISFATVYKTLDTLRDSGMLRELSIDPARKRFDPDTSAHHHAICTECGRIEDVFVDYRIKLPGAVTEKFSFMEGNHVEFYGTCNECGAVGDEEGE